MDTEKRHWSEIKSDYEEEGLRYIDAWETADNDEAGRVIAVVDMYTGRVIYNEPVARVDKDAQEAIKSVVAEARRVHPVNIERLEEIIKNIAQLEAQKSTDSAKMMMEAVGLAKSEMEFFGRFKKDIKDE